MIGLLNRITPSRDRLKPEPNPRQTIPPPHPGNLGPEYDALWKKAWALADAIDNVAGASIEERRSMMPELNRMRAELSRLESLGARPPAITIEPVKQDKRPEILWVKETNPDSCPAQCKISGTCYGRAYFDGKSGKAQECSGPCQWRTEPKKQ